MKAVQLTDGERVPVLGQGTWRMGENKSAQADEVAALRYKKILTANQSPVFIGA
jgi:diketogulonate reductase-like aldo/keto reductase